MKTLSSGNRLKYSNCLIEALKLWFKDPKGKVGVDLNSPSGFPSFYYKREGKIYRFRRKLRRYGNKSKLLFYGYQEII